MTAEQTEAIEVFCSYASKDAALWKKLEAQLRFLQEYKLISTWHHSAVQAGQERQREVDTHLSTAHIILLLISPNFMLSDQCYRIEMREAMRRHEAGEARVIPIILRPVLWEEAPFSKLHVLPTGGRPVKKWSNDDDAFVDIAKSIRKIAKELLIERLLTKAEQLDQEKRHEEALYSYEEAIRLGFLSASAFRRKGNLLLSCGRYEEALAAYQETLRLDPQIADSCFYQNKGHVLQQLKRYQEALTAYEQAIRLSMPNPDPRLYHDKGDILKQLALEAYAMAEQRSQGGSHGTPPN